LPRSYELPKVHKDSYPLRMIVSCINSPFFNLATFLKDVIDKSIKKKPLSPILADVIIQDLECNIFKTLTTHILLYYRYIIVDDVIIVAPNDHINKILYSFNSYHEKIKFIVEYGDNSGINFLDIKLLDVKEERVLKYLEKGWGESRWQRIAGFRLGNEMKGGIGRREQNRIMCRLCGGQRETWEHVWEEYRSWKEGEGSWQKARRDG
ncbi:hypothetical protein ALC56_02844, partial [Trachymyrmex septentrionalis]